jgi:hypothetical protein
MTVILATSVAVTDGEQLRLLRRAPAARLNQGPLDGGDLALAAGVPTRSTIST